MASTMIFNTPSDVAQCEDTALLWSGGKAPYSVVVISAQNPASSSVLAAVGSFVNTQAHYVVAVPSDTLIKFRVYDSSTPSLTADTTLIAVGASKKDGCLPASERTDASSATSESSKITSSSTSSGNNAQSSTTKTTDSAKSSSSSSTPATSSSSSSDVTSSSHAAHTTKSSSTVSSVSSSSATGSSVAAASQETRSSGITAAMFGGLAGGLLILILVVAGFYVWRRNRHAKLREEEEDWFAVPPPMSRYSSMSRIDTKESEVMSMKPVSPMARGRSLREFMDEPSPQPRLRPTSAHPHDPTQMITTVHYGEDLPQVVVTRTSDYYPNDTKRPKVVMSAEEPESASWDNGGAVAQRTSMQPSPRASYASYTGGSASVQVPAQMSAEEMARLADLVATRMRSADPNESPPVYH